MKARGWTHESTYNESKEWYTPPRIFKALDMEFDLDPCSPGADVVPWIPAKRHLTYVEDGLVSGWRGRVWLNPPYGMDTPRWLYKLVAHGNGIALVFSRTDTYWFHRFAVQADAMLFVKGRIQFIPASGPQKRSGAGAGSLLLAYGNDCANTLLQSGLGFGLKLDKHT